MKRLFISLLLFLSLCVQPLWAGDRYGEMLLVEGSAIVLRDEVELRYLANQQMIEIQKGDVIRLGSSSQAQLASEEGTSLKLGSNAVFSVKPWRLGQQKGYLKMLYGKARVNQNKIMVENRRFRLRTVNMVVGVRGTDWYQQATSDGVGMAVTNEGVIEVSGLHGDPQEVEQNEMSLALAGKPAVEASDVPEDVLGAFESSLDAVEPNLPEAQNMIMEDLLLDEGLIREEDLQLAKTTDMDPDSDLSGSPVIPPYDPELDEEQDAGFDRDYEDFTPTDEEELPEMDEVDLGEIDLPGITDEGADEEVINEVVGKNAFLRIIFEK